MKSTTRHLILDETPVGPLLIIATDDALSGLYLTQGRHFLERGASGQEAAQDAFLRDVVTQLQEYFAGQRQEFAVPVESVGTDFQNLVWGALREIPYGQTWTYGELANQIGRPGASRAVGLANGRNPVSIVVPCHRVIGANGSLTGYGGGLENKETLLRLEGSWVGATAV